MRSLYKSTFILLSILARREPSIALIQKKTIKKKFTNKIKGITYFNSIFSSFLQLFYEIIYLTQTFYRKKTWVLGLGLDLDQNTKTQTKQIPNPNPKPKIQRKQIQNPKKLKRIFWSNPQTVYILKISSSSSTKWCDIILKKIFSFPVVSKKCMISIISKLQENLNSLNLRNHTIL